MLTQIVNFLAQFWRTLIWWAVLDAEHVGFIRRLGVWNRDMTPGLNWKWPVLETAETEDGREYTVVIDPQSLRTKDGTDLVVRCAATCAVVDARKYLLNVCDGRANVQDLVAGELGWVVPRRPAKDVLGGTIAAELTRRAAKQARRWGIHIESVKLLDAVTAPSYRVWQNQITSSGQE